MPTSSTCPSQDTSYAVGDLGGSNPSESPVFTPFTPTPAHAVRRKPGHVPRPPNGFLLFRSNLWETEKDQLHERNHRNISRMAGARWKLLTKPEKDYWQKKAEFQKTVHAELYPGYKYAPAGSCTRPARSRSTKKNAKTPVPINRSDASIARARWSLPSPTVARPPSPSNTAESDVPQASPALSSTTELVDLSQSNAGTSAIVVQPSGEVETTLQEYTFYQPSMPGDPYWQFIDSLACIDVPSMNELDTCSTNDDHTLSWTTAPLPTYSSHQALNPLFPDFLTSSMPESWGPCRLFYSYV